MCWRGELEGYGRDKVKPHREVDSLLLEVSRRQSTLSSMAAEGGQLQEGGLLVCGDACTCDAIRHVSLTSLELLKC